MKSFVLQCVSSGPNYSQFLKDADYSPFHQPAGNGPHPFFLYAHYHCPSLKAQLGSLSQVKLLCGLETSAFQIAPRRFVYSKISETL